MKKFIFLLVITFLCLWASPAHALIRTRNVDAKDYGTGDSKFDYKVAYQFITGDVAASTSLVAMPVPTSYKNQRHNFYYAMPFKGNIVAISIMSKAALTGGSATAEVTINGYVTGVRTAINAGGNTRDSESGLVTVHTQYNAQTLEYDDDAPADWGGSIHDVNHPYGKATPLVVGDRVGVNIETSAGINVTDYVVTVIILQ